MQRLVLLPLAAGAAIALGLGSAVQVVRLGLSSVAAASASELGGGLRTVS